MSGTQVSAVQRLTEGSAVHGICLRQRTLGAPGVLEKHHHSHLDPGSRDHLS